MHELLMRRTKSSLLGRRHAPTLSRRESLQSEKLHPQHQLR